MKNSFSVIGHSVAYDTIQKDTTGYDATLLYLFIFFAEIHIVSLDASIQETHKLGIQIMQTHSLRIYC